MGVYFAEPSPALCINDETGEFVMTKYLVSVRTAPHGSWVRVISERDKTLELHSNLTPKELSNRLFGCGCGYGG